jgi:uncharacterized protein (TIRG00374 family)
MMYRAFQAARDKIAVKPLQFIIAAIIIVLLIISINPVTMVQFLFHINPFFIALAMVFYFMNHLLMAHRLKRVLGSLGHKLRYRMIFSSHMAGMIFSDVTPARSGYLYAAYDLSRKGIPLSTAMVSVTSTFIFDLIFKSLVAALGILYFYSSLFPLDAQVYIFMLFGIVLSGILLYWFITRVPLKVRGALERYRIFSVLFSYGDESRTLHRISPFIFGISFLGWLLRGLEWYCIATAVGITSLSLVDGLFLNPLLTLLSLIPVTPAGIGIQEAGIVGIFLLFQVDRTAATYFALLTRFTEALVDALGLGNFYGTRVKHEDLYKFYSSMDGDIDEKAYNSDLFVQRYFQRRRTGTITRHLDLRKGDILLDIGCGSGVQLALLAPSGYSLAVGIDVNRNALKFARGKNLKNTEFILADAQYLPIRTGAAQKVICTEVIEHVDRPDILLDELKRVLGAGGEVVLTTPNERSLWGIYEVAWDIFGRGRNYGDTHLKFYSPREIREFLKNFPRSSVTTLFFLSPFIALLGNETLVTTVERIDAIFEEWNFGVIIIAHAEL